MEKIKRATAIYTGGGQYLFYGELEKNCYLMGCDDWFIIVDTNPLIDNETFDESCYYKWQLKHLVKEIPEKDYQKTLDIVIDTILEGNTIPEWDNFSEEELEDLRTPKRTLTPAEYNKIIAEGVYEILKEKGMHLSFEEFWKGYEEDIKKKYEIKIKDRWEKLDSEIEIVKK